MWIRVCVCRKRECVFVIVLGSMVRFYVVWCSVVESFSLRLSVV